MFLILLRIFFFLVSYDFFLFTYDILCNDDIKLKNVNILILICKSEYVIIYVFIKFEV